MTIAEAVCDVTRTRGVTEIRMVDHGMTPKMKAWISSIFFAPYFFCADFFRYVSQNLLGLILLGDMGQKKITTVPGGPRWDAEPYVLPVCDPSCCQSQFLQTQGPDIRGGQAKFEGGPFWCPLVREVSSVAKGNTLRCGMGGPKYQTPQKINDTEFQQMSFLQTQFSHQPTPQSNTKRQWMITLITSAVLSWQVKVGESVPCNLTPLKPKFYLLGNLSIAASTAVKLK